MLLQRIELEERSDSAVIRCAVESAGRRSSLWFETQARFASGLSTDLYDGFLVAMLPQAMAIGEPIEVRGPMSDRLHFNLTHYFMPILSQVAPHLRPVEIHADVLTDGKGKPRPAGVGTGFSAGVDSFASLNDHYLNESRKAWRLTHLVLNNVGSHGTKDADAARRLYLARYESLRAVPENLGLELICVDSNVCDLVDVTFDHTHPSRNLAVALLFQNLFGRYFYASGIGYRFSSVAPSYSAAYSDAFTIHLFSTETLECMLSGAQKDRITKIREIVAVPGVERHLNVCLTAQPGARNCSRCDKCCRTLMVLEMIGELGRFAEVFDLEVWKKVRSVYISTELLDRKAAKPVSQEVFAFAESIGYPFSRAERIASAFTLLPKPVKRLGRSLRKRYLRRL